MKEEKKEDEKSSLERSRKGPERGGGTWSGSRDPWKSVIGSSRPKRGLSRQAPAWPWLWRSLQGSPERPLNALCCICETQTVQGFPLIRASRSFLRPLGLEWSSPFLTFSDCVLRGSPHVYGLRLLGCLPLALHHGWLKSQLCHFSRKQNWNYAVFTALWSTSIFI